MSCHARGESVPSLPHSPPPTPLPIHPSPPHSQLHTAEQRILRLESQLAEAKQAEALYARQKAAFDQYVMHVDVAS